MVLGYLAGRLGWLGNLPGLNGNLWSNITWWWLLGTVILLAIGLWLTSWYVAWRNSRLPDYLASGVAQPQSTTETQAGSSESRAQPALDQLASEIQENVALLASRRGSTGVVARLGYVIAYWPAALGTGQLAGVFTPSQLSQVSLAYYWLEQANHLEVLAYNAKNSGVAVDGEFATAKLISEIRLLDDPLAKALDGALAAIAQARYNTIQR